MKYDRELPTRRPVPVRLRDWKEVYEPFPPTKAADAGRALHGLRHPVLPHRLPAREPHPRVERPRLPRRLAARRSSACTRRTTSPSSPAGSARRRAKRRACSASTSRRSRSSRSRSRSSTTAGTRADIVPVPPTDADRQARRGRRLRARPGSPPRSSSRAPVTTVTVYERADRIGGLLRYGIPEFKMEKRHLDRRLEQMAEPRAPSSASNANVGENVPVDELRDDSDAIVLAGGATAWRDLPIPGPRAQRHLPGDGVPAAVEPGAGGRPRRAPVHAPRASTS